MKNFSLDCRRMRKDVGEGSKTTEEQKIIYNIFTNSAR